MEIKKLAELIKYYSNQYYNEGASEITDVEFDALVDELRSMSPDHPILKQVGAEPTYGKKVAHPSIMGSLNKVTNEHDLKNWSRNELLVVSPKIDGLAIRLQYENGYLVLAATRGNGLEGQDVTDNVRHIASIPETLQDFTGELRGEICMSKADFEKYASGNANPRNSAAGFLMQKDPEKTAEGHLRFICYNVFKDDIVFSTELEKRDFCESLFANTGMKYVEMVQVSEMSAVISKWNKKRNEYGIGIDGLVFAYNDLQSQEEAGMVSNRPKGKIAFKFPPVQKESNLLEIDWQVGRTGRLTPVGRIEPIELDGSMVSKVSLHTWGQVNSLNLGIGDRVLVEKAGDIIPHLVRVVEMVGEKVFPPLTCPDCGSKTYLDDIGLLSDASHEMIVDDSRVNVWCKNPLCSARLEDRVLYYLQTLEVKGIGPGIVKALRQRGDITRLSDLYILRRDRVITATGGERSADIVIEAILEKSEVPLNVFLTALGISGLGKMAGKLLASHYGTIEKVLEELPCNGYEDLVAMEGIGNKTAEAIVNGVIEFREEIDEILKYVEVLSNQEKKGNVSGKSFCLTGAMSKPRKELAKMIEDAGGDVKSSVSKGLDFLVQADVSSVSGKTKKANKYGTQVISEDDLLAMIGG